MLKRMLSFLLCLVMALSVAAPAVMAAETGDRYVSSGDLDNIFVGDNVQFENVIVDNDKVGITTPGGVFDGAVKPVPNPGNGALDAEVPDVICKCDECDTLAEHKENCSVKTAYQSFAKGIAEDVFAQWGEYTYEEQAYMLDYLRREYPTKHEDLMKLIEAPRGSDSQVLEDGTVVNVDRIPNDGNVNVQDASDKMQSIVDKFVEENEKNSTELFSYDVSVQDGKGADWQPEGTVHMELEMPGVKLHKYSIVYVVHVDDNGKATKIPAKVTEDGKIAFETPGFSTFAGFTVDFAYDGEGFSIDGLTDIKLSEVFENLKMPLYITDVADVKFSDSSLIRLDKLVDGDWKLTSLKAFDTTESLKVTMTDGTVYDIVVTDATYPYLYHGASDLENNKNKKTTDGSLDWYADGNGDLSNTQNGASVNNYWTQDVTIYVRGTGTLTITIHPASDAAGNDLLVNIAQINVDGGANLKIVMSDEFAAQGKTLTIQNVDDRTMFQVYNGTLEIRGQVNGQKLTINGKGGTVATDNPIINLNDKSNKLIVTDAIFKNGKNGAIRSRSNKLEQFIVKRCIFESSIKRMDFKNVDGKAVSGGNGGAIYIMSNVSSAAKADYVHIHKFEVVDCEFQGNKAEAGGGAMCLQGYIHNGLIAGCKFTGCSGQIGGAVDVSGNMGRLEFRDSDANPIIFENCSATNRGGAVSLRSVKILNREDNPRYTRCNSVIFNGCSFANCGAGSHGGGIAVLAQVHTFQVTGCDFTNCSTQMNGGGISIDAADLPDDFKESESTTSDPDWCAKIEACDICTNNNLGIGTPLGYHFNWGTTEDPNKSWIRFVSIDSGCTFTNCTATGTMNTDKTSISGGNGGAIEFASGCYIIERATIDDALFDGCKTNGEGNALFWSACFIKQMDLTNSTVQNCVYTDETSPGTGGTVKTTGQSCLTMMVSNCEFINNSSLTNGGGFYWNSAKRVTAINESDLDNSLPGKLQDPSCEVNDCLFDGNYARRYGGGIFVESKITIIKCNIKNNVADELGGGIAQQVYNNPSARMLEAGGATDLTLDPQTWVHHNKAKHGGGISIRANESNSITDGNPIAYTVRFELNGAAVYENQASNNGGGIYFKADSFEDDEKKQAEVDAYTKEILINAGTGTTAAVYKNTAGNNGGGIFMNSSEDTTLQVTGGYISGNKADCDAEGAGDGTGNGGGIYMTGKNATCIINGGIVGGEGTDSNGVSLGNTAICGGGIAIAGGSKIEMTGGEVSYNNVGTTKADNRQGGGIWLENSEKSDVKNSMTMSGGTVKYNTTPGGASSDGGGIFVGNDDSFTLNNGTISNNSCGDAWGGGIRIGGGCLVTLTGGTISNNKAGAGAGLLAFGTFMREVEKDGVIQLVMTQRWCTLNMETGCIVSNNIAGESGGTGNGGGIYMGYCEASFDGGQITGNVAGNNGGGLAVDHSELTIYNAEISANTAKFGGGVFASAAGTIVKITVKKDATGGVPTAQITNNIATSGGGGMCVQTSASVTVEAGSITDNMAYDEASGTWGSGGGIYADQGTVYVTSTAAASGVISHNEASNGGGLYAVNGADVTVTSGYVTYNTAHGTPSDKDTAYLKMGSLSGTGGGVFIARGTASDSSTFTLNGDSYAIYGNLADFAADDVFANGENTQLSVPKVADMDLTDYAFNPEAWFEDYPVNDTAYESGLNLATSSSGITNGKVFRYRGSDMLQRVMINDDVVNDTVNVANKYVCMTLGMPAAIDDTVVIDFGKPVDIHVLENEIMNVGNATLQGIGVLFNHAEDLYGYPNHDDRYGATHSTPFGTVTAANGIVTFTPNSMSMDKEASFSYEVKYTNSKNEKGEAQYFYYYADVTVIPATSIYYEDSFGGITYSSGWTSVSDGNVGSGLQDEDRPGLALQTAIDKDNVYGYDSSYALCQKYSMGSAQMATVSKDHPASATFTFKGTGFDVISLTDSTTGTIVVRVYDSDNNNIVNYLVDTYYGYKYENGNWTPSASGDHLYQVPVIKVDMNSVIKTEDDPDTVEVEPTTYWGYDEYKVEIVASYGAIFDHTGNNSYNFFLDAIRVYDPANNGADNATIENAYKNDGEGWPSYYEVRNLLIGKGAFNGGVSSVTGAVFIDGVNGPKMADYTNFGPNNEVYLVQNQSIAFKLNVAELNLPEGVKIASVQIGLRSFDTAEFCNYKIYNPETTTLDAAKQEEVSSATDMYYDITDLCYDASNGTGKPVVITCNDVDDGLSITNLKITFTGNPGVEVSEHAPIVISEMDVVEVLASLRAKTSTPVLTPDFATLSMENEVRYNVYLIAENMGNLTKDNIGLAVFYNENQDGTVENADEVIMGAVEDGTYYVISTNGIAAKNLGDDLYFKLFVRLEDGSYVYSAQHKYSALMYVQSILEKDDVSEQQKAAAVAMMNYGAAAQKYYGYNTDNLMNAFIKDEYQALLDRYSAGALSGLTPADLDKQDVFAANGGFASKYPGITTGGAFEINYYVTPQYVVDGTMTLYCWSEETYQNAEKLTAENADSVTTMSVIDGQYVGSSQAIVAKDLDKTVYAAVVYESNGETYSTGVLSYSIAAYCQSNVQNADLADMVNAIAVYGCAAKELFAN